MHKDSSSSLRGKLFARSKWILVAVALGFAITSATPAFAEDQSPAGPVSTIGIGPARVGGIDYRPAYVFAGSPGTIIRDRVGLQNYTTRPIRVKVYATDAFTTDSGGFDLLPEAEAPSDLGKWTNLRPRIVTIPARSTAPNSPPGVLKIPFQIKIPKNASPGDHAAGIVASTLVKDPSVGSTALIVDRRVGTRMYVQVAGQTRARLEIQDLKATYLNGVLDVGLGRVRIDYVVANTGNVVLSARQLAGVKGWFGTDATSETLKDVGPILPGGRVRLSALVDGVMPTVRGTANVKLFPYTGEGSNRQELDTVTATAGLWMIPWALLALIIAIAIAGYFVERRRRRPSPDLDPSSDQLEEVLVS